jgi:hypothetical protein
MNSTARFLVSCTSAACDCCGGHIIHSLYIVLLVCIAHPAANVSGYILSPAGTGSSSNAKWMNCGYIQLAKRLCNLQVQAVKGTGASRLCGLPAQLSPLRSTVHLRGRTSHQLPSSPTWTLLVREISWASCNVQREAEEGRRATKSGYLLDCRVSFEVLRHAVIARPASVHPSMRGCMSERLAHVHKKEICYKYK